MPYIGKQLVRGQNRKLDDISSGFNGSQTTFTLQVASQNVTVGSALQLWISLGGVIQEPTIDYTIAGNQITFTTAPAASLDFFGVIQGDVTDTNTPGDATVTTSKLATGLTVNLADGSAATSSLQLGGTDSGLFSSAADKVNVTTGGVERLEIGDSEVVFNDPSNDVDFRVESNGNTHMLFVDAGNDRVGIGTSSPGNELVINNSATGANTKLEIKQSGGGGGTSEILFSDSVEGRGRIYFDHGSSPEGIKFDTAGSFAAIIDTSGNVGIGTSSPQNDLHLSSSSTTTRLQITNSTTAEGSSDGTALIQTGNSFLINNRENEDIRFATNNSERVRIDSTGRLLVGTSTSIPNVLNGGAQIVGTAEDAYLTITRFSTNPSGPAGIILGRSKSGTKGTNTAVVNGDLLGAVDFTGADGGSDYRQAAQIAAYVDGAVSGGGAADMPGRLVFATTADGASTPTERMRIDSQGFIFPDTSSSGQSANFNATGAGGFRIISSSATTAARFEAYATSTATRYAAIFSNTNGIVGAISTNGSAVSYASFSDHRLKENVVDIADGITRVKQLQPRRFNFIADGDTTVDGFIAHEAQTVVPEAVTGTHNEVDDDGNAVMQGIDQSKLVPLLTAALQEAIAKIETLETKVAALEAE